MSFAPNPLITTSSPSNTPLNNPRHNSNPTKSMTNKKTANKWSWTPFLIGAATSAATAAIISAKPRDPVFELISIDLTSFKLSFPAIDAELILTVHVNNPNIVAIDYNSATMSIFYDGSLLGSAMLEAGSQPARSCRLVKLPARLSGVELLGHHVKKFLGDVARREMELDAGLDVEGKAKVLWWEHGYKVRVESRLRVDPVFLDVIDQDNKSQMELFVAD